MRDHRIGTVSASIVLAFVMAVPVGLLFSSQEAEGATSMLTVGFIQKVDSLNPYIAVSDASYFLYGLVYDSLVSIGNHLEPEPNLALSNYPVPLSDPAMIVSGEPFGSVWQYNLTHNAYWSDGEPFTADDVIYNINVNAQNYVDLWAFQPYAYFMQTAEKVDDYTVRIHFADRATGDPIPCAFGDMLTMPILPKHILETMSPTQLGFSWSGTPMIGTGPFMPTANLYNEWLAGSQITLVRNPLSHWATDYEKVVHFNTLVMRFYDEPLAMVYDLENRAIDVTSLPPQAYRALKDDVNAGHVQNVTTFDGPKINGYWTEVGINANNAGHNPSRLDKTIRQAMASGTNKTFIVDNYYLTLAEEGSTLISPMNAFWHYDVSESEDYDYNMIAAANLLEANGYIDINSDGIREVTATSPAYQDGLVALGTSLSYEMLIRRENPEEKDIGQYLKSQWATIGINLDLSVVDEVQLATIVYSYSYDTMIWYWSSDLDPNYQLFTQTQAAWNGWSDNKWSNASYEENYTESVKAMDRAQRQQYVYNCQRVNYLDAYYNILAYVDQTYAWRTDTFSGWGNWSEDPGRSLDNIWSGNPLWFDLIPGETINSPPVNLELSLDDPVAVVDRETNFTAQATDYDGDNLTFYVEFGDGSVEVRVLNGSLMYSASFGHVYRGPGYYMATLWVDDGNGSAGHNVSTTLNVTVIDNLPPAFESFLAMANPCPVGFDDLFEAYVSDPDYDPLSFYIEYGDGATESFLWTELDVEPEVDVYFFHTYLAVGNYTVTLWVDDGNSTLGHNVSASIDIEVVQNAPPQWIEMVSWDAIYVGHPADFLLMAYDWDGDEVNFTIDYGDGVVEVIFDLSAIEHWVFPTHTFSTSGNHMVTIWVDDGIPAAGHNVSVTAVFYVNEDAPPTNLSLWGMDPNHDQTVDFTATATDPDGDGLTMYMEFGDGQAATQSLLGSTDPVTTVFTHHYVSPGTYHVTLWVDDGVAAAGHNVSTSLDVEVMRPQATIDYLWYDLFNVPFGEWWNARYSTYGNYRQWTTSAPYIYRRYMAPVGNTEFYGTSRLNVSAWNLPQLNTMSNLEFLPFLGTARGGHMTLDWVGQYLTSAEANAIDPLLGSWNDGWLFHLNASVTLDEIAAEAVLGVSGAGFADFNAWWATNGSSVESDLLSWMSYEGNVRLDIYPAYDYAYTTLYFDVEATKIGDQVVLSIDSVTWGGEVLMARWFHELFMPTEWYMEDLHLSASIGPDGSTLFLDTAVIDALSAHTSPVTGDPVWILEPRLEDYVPSGGIHPFSDFDPYSAQDLTVSAVGNTYYGMSAPYYYTPAAWNLSVNETLSIEIPNFEMLFFVQDGSNFNTISSVMSFATVWPVGSDGANASISGLTLTYNGPMDVWTWGRDQTTYPYLESEWDRLGRLPFGLPYIELGMGSNRAPSVSLTVTPGIGDTTTLFLFNATGCRDDRDGPNGLMVRFDVNNDGIWEVDWTTQKTLSYLFTTPNTYTVRVEVKDSQGLTNTTTVQVVVSQAIPEFPSLVLPVLGAMLLVGAIVALRRRRT